MRALVIVLTDLYLGAAAGAGSAAAAAPAQLPGLEYAGRFGARRHLDGGWRDWLASRLGRADLAGVAPARVAGALLAPHPGSSWIATPLHLNAGLSQVHLDHRGLLRLPQAERSALAAAFNADLGGGALELAPLPSGDFLLRGALEPVRSTEPARIAGGEIAPALPQGREAAALRRTGAEIEMWLHAHDFNRARLAGGEPPVNALWLWGASGRAGELQVRAVAPGWRAFGEDAYLGGLWHLLGDSCQGLPPEYAAPPADGCSVLALAVADELRKHMNSTFLEALRALDERFIEPALARLRAGALEQVTLVANDTALAVRRASALRFWRRGRAGLGALT